MPCSQLSMLANHMGATDNPKALRVSLTKEKMSQLSVAKSQSIYETSADKNALQTRPWRNSPKYFTEAFVTTLALVKMSAHAKSGGSIEVMGMLTGKVVRNSIVVMDVYALPVEGTETRVNAQNEAYEYMVQYLDSLCETRPDESIVGWYHSHPGYGCWLSGIDVATQSLNQNFQDPYLAIVVDPSRSQNQGKVDIGAFRTFPDGFREKKDKEKNREDGENNEKEKSKRKGTSDSENNHRGSQDMGVHADDYYSLDIKLFKGPHDADVVNAILEKSWVSGIVHTVAQEAAYEKNVGQKIEKTMSSSPFAGPPSSTVPANSRRYETLFERIVGLNSASGSHGSAGNSESLAANRGAGNVGPAGGASDANGRGRGRGFDMLRFELGGGEEIEKNGDKDEIYEVDENFDNHALDAGEDIDADSQFGADLNEDAEEAEEADEDDANSIRTREYDGFGAAQDSDAMDEEDADTSSGQNADADGAWEGYDGARTRETGRLKGIKRNLHTSSEESKSGVTVRPGPRDNRKRFAGGDLGASAADNDLKHKMQSLQLELQRHVTAARQIGHAELLKVVGRRAQQRVFGKQEW